MRACLDAVLISAAVHVCRTASWLVLWLASAAAHACIGGRRQVVAAILVLAHISSSGLAHVHLRRKRLEHGALLARQGRRSVHMAAL